MCLFKAIFLCSLCSRQYMGCHENWGAIVRWQRHRECEWTSPIFLRQWDNFILLYFKPHGLCNKHLWISIMYLLAALISKSMVDSKLTFFSLRGHLIKLWRKEIINITITIVMNIYYMLDASCVFLIVIQKYYTLLSHFHKEEIKRKEGYVTSLSNQI